MAGINKVILVGNLGRDPEVSYTPSGTAVAKFSIATSEKWTDKETGEKKDKTEWHRITAFGRLGEICGEYLSKGKQVYIEGKLQYGSYEKDGVTRYTTDIIANQMQMLGSRGDANMGSSMGSSSQGVNGPPMQQGPNDEDIPF